MNLTEHLLRTNQVERLVAHIVGKEPRQRGNGPGELRWDWKSRSGRDLILYTRTGVVYNTHEDDSKDVVGFAAEEWGIPLPSGFGELCDRLRADGFDIPDQRNERNGSPPSFDSSPVAYHGPPKADPKPASPPAPSQALQVIPPPPAMVVVPRVIVSQPDPVVKTGQQIVEVEAIERDPRIPYFILLASSPAWQSLHYPHGVMNKWCGNVDSEKAGAWLPYGTGLPLLDRIFTIPRGLLESACPEYQHFGDGAIVAPFFPFQAWMEKPVGAPLPAWGLCCAVQLIYLTSDGRTPEGARPAKRTIGTKAETQAIHCFSLLHPAEAKRWALCEGLADALSIFRTQPEGICVAWSGGKDIYNRSTLRSLAAKGTPVECWVDGDDGGGALKAARKFQEQGGCVEIKFPSEGHDPYDDLRDEPCADYLTAGKPFAAPTGEGWEERYGPEYQRYLAAKAETDALVEGTRQ